MRYIVSSDRMQYHTRNDCFNNTHIMKKISGGGYATSSKYLSNHVCHYLDTDNTLCSLNITRTTVESSREFCKYEMNA